MASGASMTVAGGGIQVRDQSVLRVRSGAGVSAVQVAIDSGGLLENCGEIEASVVNAGQIVAACGTGIVSIFIGNITNSGTFRVSHGTALVATGAFANSGLLDLITAQQDGPPPGLINTGTVVDAASVRVSQILTGPTSTEIRILGIEPHTYQLQANGNLSSIGWTDVGPIQIGNSSELIFVHPVGLEHFDHYFFRVKIGDQ